MARVMSLPGVVPFLPSAFGSGGVKTRLLFRLPSDTSVVELIRLEEILHSTFETRK